MAGNAAPTHERPIPMDSTMANSLLIPSTQVPFAEPPHRRALHCLLGKSPLCTQRTHTYATRPPLGSELPTPATTTTFVTITYLMLDEALFRRMTTQKTTTTCVAKHSSYALRGESSSFTVARSRSSLGHSEGATKAVRAVRAATAFSPVASGSHLFQSASLLIWVSLGFF